MHGVFILELCRLIRNKYRFTHNMTLQYNTSISNNSINCDYFISYLASGCDWCLWLILHQKTNTCQCVHPFKSLMKWKWGQGHCRQLAANQPESKGLWRTDKTHVTLKYSANNKNINTLKVAVWSSIIGQVMFDLRRTKLRWGRFSPNTSFSSASSHSTICSTFINHPTIAAM